MKLDAKKGFAEMPLLEFLAKCPEAVSLLPATMDILDENYIVRVHPRSGVVEFGYASDDWVIQ